jgi:hypothetical protein
VVNHLLLEFLDHRYPLITPIEAVFPLLDVLYGGVPGVRTSSVLALFSGPGDASHIVEVRLCPGNVLTILIAIPA